VSAEEETARMRERASRVFLIDRKSVV